MGNAPAFPFQVSNADEMSAPEYGMTLRDWFAGQALVIARSTIAEYELTARFGGRYGIKREEIQASDAYAIADAMLAARESK